LARTNYGFQKRQKEIAKQQKKEEKRQRKLERKVGPDEVGEAPADGGAEETESQAGTPPEPTDAGDEALSTE
jgi:hypothetical protein